MEKRDYYRNGTIEMIALSLLREGDYYGYQLVQMISDRSDGMIAIQIGSLYPALYRLRDEGYVTERQVPIGKRKFRVYYHLEPEGLEFYQALLADHQAFETALNQILEPKDTKRNGGA